MGSFLDMFFYILLALLGAASAANVICTGYGKDVGGASGGYYERPIPKQCNIGNWTPSHRIEERVKQCPGGWKKYKKSCYKDTKRTNFRQGEQNCNQMKAHIFLPNDREEYLWVEQNVMTNNGWYWTGLFCSVPRSLNPGTFYAPTGQDMREIQKKLNAKMHPNHYVDEDGTPCAAYHRNNDTWRWQYHHSGCMENRGIVCEAPLA